MSSCSSQSLKMSQCVPNWDLDENPTPIKLPFHPNSNMNDAKASDVTDPTTLDYEVAELTWENGQLALHGLGPPRIIGGSKPVSSKYTWEKPRANGTLESIVHQAVQLGPCETPICHDELVPWFDHQRAAGSMTMDALVPASSNSSHFVHNLANQITDPNQRRVPRKSTRAESSGGTTSFEIRGKEREERTVRKRARVPRVVMAREGCSRNQSVSISETFGRDSRQQVGADSCDMDLDMGFTSTSLDSGTNPNTLDDRDSVSHTRPQKQARTEEDNKSTQNDKSTISTKRSRAAAIHNQSERKRRDKINQRMKTLQKLVPNSSKTDKASMLDEVIEYLKTLQAQVHMMSRMSMPQMMMPMTMQQQLQMNMMAQMGMAGMGMGMGMGGMMDPMNPIGRPNIPGMPHQVLNPAAFMSMASWDGTNDRVPGSSAVMPDPMASFLAACQTQPMTMDAYSRMAALFQQLNQNQQVPNSKS